MTADHLDPLARAAIRRVLVDPLFELVPLKNALDQASHLPAGATVSVTASPARGMNATLDLAEALCERGFDVVPHLSARLTIDRNHLASMVDRLARVGVSRVLVVGGDGRQSGEYADGLSLLRGIEEIGHRFSDVGVPAYPEGHPEISDESLDRALVAKQPHATSMTTQMCFSGEVIVRWLVRLRNSGVTMPVVLGMPGVVDRRRLLEMSARIGVGDSVRFLRGNTWAAARFMMPGRFNPAELLEEVGAGLDDPRLDVRGVHLYTFNACDTTEEWRREYLQALG